MPCQERVRAHDGADFLEHAPPQVLCYSGQPDALIVGQAQPTRAEVLAETSHLLSSPNGYLFTDDGARGVIERSVRQHCDENSEKTISDASKRPAVCVAAELPPRTFCTFPREFSSLRRPGPLSGSERNPRQALHIYSCDVRSRFHPASPRDGRASGSRRSEGGQVSVIRRPRRLRGTSRRPPIGWSQRGPVVPRPRVKTGRRALRHRCRNTSRPASVRETPNGEARGCAPGRRTRPIDGPW